MTLLDTTTVPLESATSAATSATAPATIAAADRATRLAAAGTAWTERIARDASSAALVYRVQGSGEGSVATRIRSGRHEFLVDEPAALAGDDLAPSPVEYALAALVSCQIVVYRLYANALGIVVDDIDVTAEGDLDARRLFGIDGGARAGLTGVRLAVTITGPETEDRYRELQAVVDEHCPVFDLFANPTPVSVTVSTS